MQRVGPAHVEAAHSQTIYPDTTNFSNKDFAPFALLVGETWSSLPAETDPPTHALYRKFVNPIFTPKAINKLDERIRQYAKDHCAAILAKASCDFMADFAFEFPIKVFLGLMGAAAVDDGWVETPREREARLNVTNGCVTHIDFGSLRSGAKRPAVGFGNPTPAIPGLLIGGAGAHPGGGISGIPGRIAATRVQRYLKKAKR